MADDVEEAEDKPKKSLKLPLIVGLVLAMIGGGGGFFAVTSGMILAAPELNSAPSAQQLVSPIGDISYVGMDALVVSLHEDNKTSHLKFRAQLEVPSAYKTDVELVLPRVIDVMNTYLRALNVSDIETPASMTKLRAQLLRRIQIVTGKGRVNDLLIMEFVVS